MELNQDTVDKPFLVEIRRVPTLTKNTSESLNPCSIASNKLEWFTFFSSGTHSEQMQKIRRLSLLAKMRRAGSCNGQGIKRQKPGQSCLKRSCIQLVQALLAKMCRNTIFTAHHCTSIGKLRSYKSKEKTK